MAPNSLNSLYYGDCLTIMREWPSQCVDLIYLDPPFNSNRQYNAIYRDETGRPLPDQIEAFCDVWELTPQRLHTVNQMSALMLGEGVDSASAEFCQLWMQALRDTQPRLLAYLSYMAERLLIMRRILKPTGSIYYHCDPQASHYVKVLMDVVFGHTNFQNEIVWQRAYGHNDGKRYGAIHDVILFYGRSRHRKWNTQYTPYDNKALSKFSRRDSDGRLWKPSTITAGHGLTGGGSTYTYKGRTAEWLFSLSRMKQFDDKGKLHFTPSSIVAKCYLDEMKGRSVQSIWTDVSPVSVKPSERVGQPTQKPVDLLERVIAASSDPGDVVLDPFCGSGTTLEAAHNLGRQWVGVDISAHTVKRVAGPRLTAKLNLVEGRDFAVSGGPSNIEEARHLQLADPYHFQTWTIEQLGAFVTARRSKDTHPIGRLYFEVPCCGLCKHQRSLQALTVVVEGGCNIDVHAVCERLRSLLESGVTLMSGLVVLHTLNTQQEQDFAAEATRVGTITLWNEVYPRMQLLTVEDILSGKRFRTPAR